MAGWFDLAFDALTEDAMPLAVLLDQLPSRVVVGDRHLMFVFEPIGHDPVPQRFLCIVRDETDRVRSSESEAARNDSLELLARWVRDNRGAALFVDDGDALLTRIQAPVENEEQRVVLKRDLHTWKGNAGVWGQTALARQIHAAEDLVELEGQLPASAVDDLREGWLARTETVRRMNGDRGERVEVPRTELQRLVQAVREGADRENIVRLLEDWKEEPAAVALSRLGDYARSLARRLGKADIEVDVDGGQVRLPSARYQHVLSALVHVVRNAVDHGFADDHPSPRLVLRAYRDLGATVLSISDNGGGIPLAPLRERLAALGRDTDDDRRVLAGIWEDGVSTSESISQTSGRGVGLAAVRQTVLAADGEVAVSTAVGKGTTFTFTFQERRLRAVGE